MSLKDDLKRIFFGAKSVAKSAADKTSKAAGEAADEVREKGGEWLDKAKEKAGEWGEDLKEGTAGARARARELMDDISDKVREESEYARERGREFKGKAEEWFRGDEKNSPEDTSEPDLSSQSAYDSLLDDDAPPAEETPPQKGPIDFEEGLEEQKKPRKPSAFEEWGDQTLDKAARTGAKAMDKAGELGGKVMDVSEDVGERVLDLGGKILGKAKDMGSDLMDRAGDAMQKAQDEADRESLKSTEQKAREAAREAQERADKALENTKGGLLDGQDDFFAKAERYAQGDYHDKGGRNMSIEEDPDYEKSAPQGKARGFEDLDGDGDEIIDDAIIDDDSDDDPKPEK